MIRYQSTRGEKKLYKFSEVILKGIADDGGLFVPSKIPRISEHFLESLLDRTYQDRALFIFNLFQTDFSHATIRQIVQKAYGKNFDHEKIAPLIHLKDNQFLLELWHGPTFSFKDMALQIMPLFFAESLKKKNICRKNKNQQPINYLLLVATSGDTGSAAMEGYINIHGVNMVVFYPDHGISNIQRLQMVTQEADNLFVFGVKSDFDGVQKSIKEIFNDKKFNRELFCKYNILLSSANSINWGRLLSQIVYHISGYLDLVRIAAIKSGEEIDIAVPTGNFGNILAAYYAKVMGLPIRRLICASNANNILAEFLQRGIYDVRGRKLINTPSPSMDIIKASNIERLLYEITKDPEKVAYWMRRLKDKKIFKVDKLTLDILHRIFYADWVSNELCLSTIKNVYEETGYLMDPHTAVAQAVVALYQQKYGNRRPIVICATAHFGKFTKDVYAALRGYPYKEIKSEKRTRDDLQIFKKIKRIVSRVSIPQKLIQLRRKKIRHKTICKEKKEEIEKLIKEILKNKSN